MNKMLMKIKTRKQKRRLQEEIDRWEKQIRPALNELLITREIAIEKMRIMAIVIAEYKKYLQQDIFTYKDISDIIDLSNQIDPDIYTNLLKVDLTDYLDYSDYVDDEEKVMGLL